MYLVWFPEDLEKNYIEKFASVTYTTGGDSTSAFCYILRPVKDGVIDKNHIGVAFFNLSGTYDIDNAVKSEWNAAIATFPQIYKFLSTPQVHSLLEKYGVKYTDALEWFPFDDNKKIIAQKAIDDIENYYRIREKAMKAFCSTNCLESW